VCSTSEGRYWLVSSKGGLPALKNGQTVARDTGAGTLPTVSVVTPSLNQVRFIDRTLRSVQAQSYPPLEHIVVDGLSQDGTLDVLRRASGSAHVVTLSDLGQSRALNHGFQIARGEVVGWLNSDDLYLPTTLEDVARAFARRPDVAVVYGDCYFIDASDRLLWTHHSGRVSPERLLTRGNFLAQPAVFFRSAVFERVGYLDETLSLAMDFDFWIRLSQRYQFYYLPKPLACFRWHERSKSASRGFDAWREVLQVVRKHGGGWTLPLAVSFGRFVFTHTRKRALAPVEGIAAGLPR
jgi:glycosyltransferase involved in cell wall biosynthesis